PRGGWPRGRPAGVAKLAAAPGLGPGVGGDVGVGAPSPAPRGVSGAHPRRRPAAPTRRKPEILDATTPYKGYPRPRSRDPARPTRRRGSVPTRRGRPGAATTGCAATLRVRSRDERHHAASDDHGGVGRAAPGVD